MSLKHHTNSKLKRVRRVRSKINGTATRPRLSIDRTNQHLFAQLIDDSAHKTILGINSKSIKTGTKTEKSKVLGQDIAKAALKSGVKMATLDRGAYRYGGRIKTFADAAREAGLQI